MAPKNETSTRIEEFLSRDIAGVPLALIMCAIAAVALGFGVAMASTLPNIT